MKAFKYMRFILPDMSWLCPWNDEWNVRAVQAGEGVVSVQFSPVKHGTAPYYVDHGVSVLECLPMVELEDA